MGTFLSDGKMCETNKAKYKITENSKGDSIKV